MCHEMKFNQVTYHKSEPWSKGMYVEDTRGIFFTDDLKRKRKQKPNKTFSPMRRSLLLKNQNSWFHAYKEVIILYA